MNAYFSSNYVQLILLDKEYGKTENAK